MREFDEYDDCYDPEEPQDKGGSLLSALWGIFQLIISFVPLVASLVINILLLIGVLWFTLFVCANFDFIAFTVAFFLVVSYIIGSKIF